MQVPVPVCQRSAGVEGLRRRAEREMIVEAHTHDIYRIIQTCPGIGEIRAPQPIPVVVTPFRFVNKRVFWSYCGSGIVTRSSSDWVRGRDGQWIKAPVQRRCALIVPSLCALYPLVYTSRDSGIRCDRDCDTAPPQVRTIGRCRMAGPWFSIKRCGKTRASMGTTSMGTI